MSNKMTSRVLLLAFLIAFLAFFPRAEALVINSYDPALYDRFSSTFFASSYDWSGVGWNTIDPTQSIAMISPRHFVCANHYPIYSPSGQPTTVTFRNRKGEPKTYEVATYSRFSFTDEDGTHTADLALGWLKDDIPDTALISHYPVLNAEDPETSDLDPSWYLYKEIYVYGWSAKVGENVINDFTGAYSTNYPNKYADLTFCSTFDYYDSPTYYYPGLAGGQGGDSGSPTFIPWNDQLTVSGTHFGVSDTVEGTWTTYDAFIPYYLDKINIAMASGSPYSVDVINVIPEPATGLLLLVGLPYLFIRQRR